MSDFFRMLLIMAGAGTLVLLIVSATHVQVHGLPVFRGRWRAWKLERQWRSAVADRAIELMQDNPTLPFQCENWPKWPALCGRCCAVSQATDLLVAARNAKAAQVTAAVQASPMPGPQVQTSQLAVSPTTWPQPSYPNPDEVGALVDIMLYPKETRRALEFVGMDQRRYALYLDADTQQLMAREVVDA